MAADKCISTLIELERQVDYLGTLCRVVHDVAPEQPPDWLALVWPLVAELAKTMEEHGNAARAPR